MYNEKVLDHFSSPRNVGELPDADGIGENGNFKCGDMMKMFIKVKDGIIDEVRFKTFGCGAAIACSSMMTELVKGRTVEEALSITNQDVANELGGLPPVKLHCSNLAADALRDAIADYRKRQNDDQTA
ncbi:MAG TPA: Fe-S cluster assembly scaffold protein NifU [Candidatus Limnocylindrales bacterium]|nr:Fe-S cluster assembly scaffold protein NifU [Candidatus Limnocylindrales bacterium]